MLAIVVFGLRLDVLEVLVLVEAGHDAANARLLLSLRMVLDRNERRITVGTRRGKKGNGGCSGSSAGPEITAREFRGDIQGDGETSVPSSQEFVFVCSCSTVGRSEISFRSDPPSTMLTRCSRKRAVSYFQATATLSRSGVLGPHVAALSGFEWRNTVCNTVCRFRS